MHQSKVSKQSGFTLIEILVVMGILAVLLAIVLIAINPAKHFQDANNTQRRSDATAILNAVHSYMSANKGAVPSIITSTATNIGDGSGEIDLCSVVVPNHIADLPLDPSTGTKTPASSVCTGATSYSTGYTIKSASGNRITVAAPAAEGGVTISVTR